MSERAPVARACSGKKYHSGGCWYLAGSKILISLKDAREGLEGEATTPAYAVSFKRLENRELRIS